MFGFLFFIILAVVLFKQISLFTYFASAPPSVVGSHLFSGGAHTACVTRSGSVASSSGICEPSFNCLHICWVIVGFMRRDFFHRIASLLHWDGMLVCDVTLIHTLSFEWMVIGTCRISRRLLCKLFVQTLAKHAALRLSHRLPTHSFSTG